MKTPAIRPVLALRLLSILSISLLAADPAPACEAGACSGDVTVDGRPICWKLRMQADAPNEVHYFAAGEEHFAGLGPATHAYLGAGPHDDAPGPARQGLSAAGLAIGFNNHDGGDWPELNHHALGHAATTDDVDAYLMGMTTLGTIHYCTDARGEAVLWETAHDPVGHWAYDVLAPARAAVLRDFDEDGDEISYAGWIARANDIHMHTDGTDSLLYGEESRAAAAQTVTGRLVDAGVMDVATLAREFFRHDVLAWDNTVSSMIVHGVRPDEDPRLATFWTALGHSEAAVFVPVWIHGVEADGLGTVPAHLDHDSGACVYVPAKGLINDEADEATLQLRTLPFEARLFDAVVDELLPVWRARDWDDEAVVDGIGHEMKRVQERMDADAYSLLDGLYVGDRHNHAPLESRIVDWRADGLRIDLTADAIDADGTIVDATWDYGDGRIGRSTSHVYDRPGTYLVSFTATDDDGVSFTDWEFVVAEDPALAVDGAGRATLACRPNPLNPGTVFSYELRDDAVMSLVVFDVAGRVVRTLARDMIAPAGIGRTRWDGRDDAGRHAAAGVYFCRLETGAAVTTRRVVVVR